MTMRKHPDMMTPEHTESEPQITSSEILHFNRHNEKGDKAKSEDPDALSPEGIANAFARGQQREGVSNTAVAFGSEVGPEGNERALHTALEDLAGALRIEGITGQESLQELQKAINESDGRDFGARGAIDRRLGFTLNDPEHRKGAVNAIKEKRLLKYLVEESDDKVIAAHNLEDYSYTRSAGRIAEVVKKYVGTASRWDELANDPEKHYGKVLDRFLGSHTGIVDVFLLRLVEKLKGPDERDRLIEALGGGTGFNAGEGFEIHIDTLKGQDAPRIRVQFERKGKDNESVAYHLDEEVPVEIIDELIADGKVLDEKIKASAPAETAVK